MKQVRWLAILRWFCVIPIIVASFIAAIRLSVPFDDWCYNQAVRFGYQTPIEERIPPYLPLSWYGAFAAIVVVVSGVVMAPAHRRVVALTLFVIGAFIAMTMFDALIGPLFGGTLAVTGVFLATRRPVSSGVRRG